MAACALAGRPCPRTSNPEAKHYCPAWSAGVVYRHDVTGEERVVNCAFEALMPALTQVIAASNRPAAAIEATRNEIAEGLGRVAQAMAQVPMRLLPGGKG